MPSETSPKLRVKYVGNSRSGYLLGYPGSGKHRFLVKPGAIGHMLRAHPETGAILCQFSLEGRKVRLWCLPNELKKLVPKVRRNTR